MDNSILAGKYLRDFMVNNAELMELVSSKNIFPLVANADTTFPFIVYSRTSLTPVYTKNLLSDNEASFTVIVVSNKYTQSLYIANAVRHALEGYRYKDSSVDIHPIRLDSVTEDTVDDAYIQRMTFSFSIS